MATPFQERSPCQTASYPIARRAFTGKAPCSALSSWRLTTSGSALANQAKRLSSRLLMLLMLKVAILTKSSLYLYVWVRLSKGATEVCCAGRHYFTGGKKWSRLGQTQNALLIAIMIAFPTASRRSSQRNIPSSSKEKI